MDVPLNDHSSTSAEDESYWDADDCLTPTLDEHILDGSDSDDVQSKEETDTDLYSAVSSDVKNVVSGSSQQDPCPSEIIDSDHAKHVGAEEQSNKDDEVLQTDISGKRGTEEDPKPGDYGSNRSSGQTSKAESISVNQKRFENKNDNSENQDTKPDEKPKASKPIKMANTSKADNTDQSFKPLVEDKVNPPLRNTSHNQTNRSLLETNSPNVGEAPREQQITISFDNDTFFCSACDFKAKGHSFEEHLMCHLNIKPYQCIYCPEAFVNCQQMSQHVSERHTGNKMNCDLKALSRAKMLMAEASIIEDVPNLGSQEMESMEYGQLNKDQVDPERNDKITLQSVVEMVTEGNEMISQEMEVDVEGTSETDRQQLNGEQMDIVKRYDTMMTSTDKEESSLVHDSSQTDSRTTDNDHENISSKLTDQVSEKDSLKECGLSERLADGQDRNKKKTSEINYFTKMNDDGRNAISSSVEDNFSGNTCDVPLDSDGMQVTSTSDVAEEADALKAFAPRVAHSVANNVTVLKEEHDSDVLSSKEHQDKLQADPSSDSQKYLSSILVSQDSTGEIDSKENIFSANNDRSIVLETETAGNSSWMDNGNMMMAKFDSSSDVDEGQQLKIIDTFSLDKDDNSFSEPFGSNFTSEETAVLDEVCVKTNENNSVPSTSEDDEDELPGKCSAEQTTNSSVPFGTVTMGTMNADNDAKSPDEIQALPSFTVDKTVTLSEAQATPEPVSLNQDTKHMRNPNFYVCGLVCSFSCLNSIEFRDHLLLEHAGEVSFPCYYCGYVAHSEDGLLKHMINHAQTYNKAAPLYYCGVGRCKFGTNLLTDFLNHMQIMHSDCAVFKCKECDHLTDSIENLVKHFDENYLHVVNCPHCTCKGSDRRVILRHIAQYHPGKAKMVQVAKQMICKERKQNNFYHDQTPSDEPESEPMPVTVTEINVEQQTANAVESFVDKISSMLRIKKGETVDRHIDTPKCDHCTFVARDTRRLQSHLNCHCMPRKIKYIRFRCIYCPQAFQAFTKFKSHISCHPGLIKYWMYCCRCCVFNTNQRHVILKHIETKDDLHVHRGEDEDMFSVVERVMESQVLECDRCNFQTRHKLHLQIHCAREHQIIKAAAQSSTDRDSTPPAKSSAVSVKRPVIQVPQYNKPSRNISLTAVSSGQVKENQLKKFKCPHCQYLVPKAADLKQHVKRHDYLGKISLHIFRCKYCSSSSTARDLVFEHIRDKHPGKALQLMRKTVDIDTQGTDNTFSETSVAEAPISSSDYNPQIPAINPVMPISSSNPVIDSFHCETCSFSTPSREAFDNHLQLHNTKGGIKGVALPEEDSDKEEEEDSSCTEMKPDSSDTQMEAVPIMDIEKILQVVIVPECDATDTLTAAARCPQCYFASGYRSAFVSHVKSRHPEVIVVMRNNSQVQEVTEVGTIGKPFYLPEDLSPEVLVIPEKRVFSQAVGCPKCPNFATYFRRNLFIHIQRHHPEVTSMGLSSWNGWRHDNVAGSKTGTLSSGLSPTVQDESCIIGSGNLDEKIAMLYENNGANLKCLICTIEISKRFFMHIHLLRHMDISLWKCAFCAYQGLAKHKIKQHIKERHPKKPTTIVYVKVDIDKKVSDFLKVNQLDSNRNAQTFLSVPEKAPLPEVATASSSNTITTTLDSKMKMSGPLGTSELDEKIRSLYETRNNKSMCNLCSCKFTRKFAIHRHIVTNHLKVALVGCGYCDFTDVKSYNITKHIVKQHPKAPINVVTLDVDIAKKVTELLSSTNSEKGLVDVVSESQQNVDSSPKSYLLGNDLLDQKLQCLYTKESGKFQCKMCEWNFPRVYGCHRHLFVRHLKISLFGCAYCRVKAVERYKIISHIKDVHPGSPRHPQILNVDLDQRISKLLSGVSQAAETPSTIQCNTDSHPAHPEEFLPEQTPDISDDIEPADTGVVVALFGQKRSHSDPVLPSVLSPASPKKVKTGCRTTDVTTNIKVMGVAEGSVKKFVCEFCQFSSVHHSKLHRHVMSLHEKYREKECRYCSYKTFRGVHLKQHMAIEHKPIASVPKWLSKATHLGKTKIFSAKQYLNCGYCSYKSALFPEVKAHVELEHRSESLLIVSPYAWRFICKICSLKIIAKVTMKEHLNRHIEFWPYTCRRCGRSYPSSANLKTHFKLFQHSDDVLYLTNDQKEKTAMKLLIQSHRRAEMVTFKPDLSPGVGGHSEKTKTVKLMRNKPQVRKNTSTGKTESLGSAVKFKVVKKKQATAHKVKFRCSQNCPFAKKVPISIYPRKDSSLVYKDSFSCTRCSFKSSVSLDEVRKHHQEAHPDKEFVWHDGRLQLTCTESGAIVKCPSQMKMPPADEQFTHKQLRGKGKGTKFYCNHCDFSCWVLQAVKSHIRMHQPKRSVCPYCRRRYHKRDTMEKHLLASHPNLPAWIVHMHENESTTYVDEVPTDDNETVLGKQKKKLKSKLLGPKTKRHQRLMAEYKEWHAQGKPVGRTSLSDVYCCHQCSFTNRSLYVYRLHLANHGNYRHLVTDLTSKSLLKCGFCPLHGCIDEKIIDMTSLASLENRTEEMPRLVNLDPQVLLEDIQDLTDQDLSKLMPLKSGVLQFDFTVTPTSHPYGEKNAQHVDDLMVDTDLSVEGSSTEQAEGLERCSKRRKLSPEDDYHKAVADSVSVQETIP